MDEKLCRRLGKMTEEMYLKLERVQKDCYHEQLQQNLEQVEQPMKELLEAYQIDNRGRILEEQSRRLQMFYSEYQALYQEIGSKFKICIRGCGKAGKSTLLNALLQVDDETGSKIGRNPCTFTIDTFTDELGAQEAIVRAADEKGALYNRKMSRREAKRLEEAEETAFNASKKRCQELLLQKLENVFLPEEQRDIIKDVYENNLLKTSIREIKWGIGKNDFLHNCLIMDTPGLSQELRFTNVLQDVRHYEVDGILLVISTENMKTPTVQKIYQEELKEFSDIYRNKKVIMVINNIDTEITYDSRAWKRCEREAVALFGSEIADMVCVNSRLAYEGNLEHNAAKIEQSNIAELRSRINQCFVEKNSEEYLNGRMARIQSFARGFCRMMEENREELARVQQRYEEISLLIQEQGAATKEKFNREQRQITEHYKSVCKQRIEANASYVEKVHTLPRSEWEEFIKTKILQNDNILMRKLVELQNQQGKEAYQDFQELQKRCIVSDYQTEKYAYQNFQMYQEKQIPMLQASGVDISAMDREAGSMATNKMIKGISNLADDIEDALAGFLGGKSQGILKSVIRAGASFVDNMLHSPQQRLERVMNAWIDNTARSYGIEKEIRQYKEHCCRIRDISMEELCADKETVIRLQKRMEEQKNNMVQCDIQRISLQDILLEGAEE